MPKFPKNWAFEREFSVYTHGMRRSSVACKRRGDGHHHRHAARGTATLPTPTYLPPHDINNRPSPHIALVYRAKMPKFPKIWAFARRISCVYTRGMRRAGAWHANGAVMPTITATPPASCTACLYSPTTTTLGKKNLAHPLIQRSFIEQKCQNFPKFGRLRDEFRVCTHTACSARALGMQTARGWTPPPPRRQRHDSLSTPTISRQSIILPLSLSQRSFIEQKCQNFPKFWLLRDEFRVCTRTACSARALGMQTAR